MRRLLIYLVYYMIAISFSDIATAQSYSELWGKNGEKWTPDSRLPDFSFAGYHFGEDPIPKPKVVANVKDFGAKGDGKTDDTEAFKNAIEATKAGAILIPEGRYILRNILWIEKSNIVLRGKAPIRPFCIFQWKWRMFAQTRAPRPPVAPRPATHGPEDFSGSKVGRGRKRFRLSSLNTSAGRRP